MDDFTDSLLDANQRERAIELMRAYLAAPGSEPGKSRVQMDQALDGSRRELITNELGPLLTSYLAGNTTSLADFKSQIDSINKRHEYWGFRGIKGQMFFNMLVNTSTSLQECDAELKAALALPASEDAARSRIRTFASYVKRLGDDHVERGGAGYGRPKPGSIPFFLSYFWQIQDCEAWPVYYTNTINVMQDANLWRPVQDLAEDYLGFKRLQSELAVLFSKASGRSFGLYDVEHVFWFHGGNPYGESGTEEPAPTSATPPQRSPSPGPTPAAACLMTADGRLPDSYVPPVIGILPQMALNTPELAELAVASGTSLERAFEKSVNAAFTVLGYDTQLLGQGQGRVPDGRAIDADNSYAILWDAKARADGYSMGTDDRTIREYIVTQSRELKRRRSLRNIYYLVVSSRFRDDYDDTIRMLKMDTDINEVCLVEAEALLAMVDAKLREPLQVTLGPDGLQRLFCSSGILAASRVREMLG